MKDKNYGNYTILEYLQILFHLDIFILQAWFSQETQRTARKSVTPSFTVETGVRSSTRVALHRQSWTKKHRPNLTFGHILGKSNLKLS